MGAREDEKKDQLQKQLVIDIGRGGGGAARKPGLVRSLARSRGADQSSLICETPRSPPVPGIRSPSRIVKKQMAHRRVSHLLFDGGAGGIEPLCLAFLSVKR